MNTYKNVPKKSRSLNNFLEKLISEAVEYREPNEKTRKAMDQAIRDAPYIDYKKYHNTEDLLKDLMKD